MKEHAKDVLDAFSRLTEAIGTVVAEVKEEAKDAIENESGNAVKLASRKEALTSIEGRVRLLRDEFQRAMSVNPVVKPPDTPPPSPSSQTKLVVMFEDGVRFDYHLASDTFAESLKKMGLGRVLPLNKKLSGAPLVSEKRIGNVGQKCMDGYYVTTQSSTPDKKKMLDKVAKILGERIVVKVVAK